MRALRDVFASILQSLLSVLMLRNILCSVGPVVIDPQWVTLAETAAMGATVFGILNPASGPGDVTDTSYPDVIDYVKGAGAKVMMGDVVTCSDKRASSLCVHFGVVYDAVVEDYCRARLCQAACGGRCVTTRRVRLLRTSMEYVSIVDVCHPPNSRCKTERGVGCRPPCRFRACQHGMSSCQRYLERTRGKSWLNGVLPTAA